MSSSNRKFEPGKPPVLVWNPTDEDLVRCWLSFTELHKRGQLRFDFGSESVVAAHQYWRTSGTYSNKKALQRIVADPHDLLIGFNFGIDLMDRSHGCLMPAELPAILLKQDGRSIDEIVGAARLAAALKQLVETRETRRRETDAATREKTMSSFETAPFALADPLGSLWTTYGIAGGEVYVRNSILGFRFGDCPKVPVRQVTRVFPRGSLWGDIVFCDSSGEAVVWRKVFRPEATLRRAQEIMSSLA